MNQYSNKIISNGFTLIEVFFAISITVLMLFAASNFIIQGYKANIFGAEQDLAVQNARKVGQKMVREIREATNSDRGDYLMDDVQQQTLSFYSDTDKDDDVEKIRYFLDNNTLKRGIINPTGNPTEYLSSNEIISEMAEFVNNQGEEIFTYYDTNNALISDPIANKDKIRLIHISLKINVTPTIAPNDYYVEMDAQVRNLKDNL